MTTPKSERVSKDIEQEFSRRARKMCESNPDITFAKAYVKCVETDPQLCGLLERALVLENYLRQP